MKAANNFYSGTSGLVLPVAKSSYPEEFKEASRLTYYASLFNSVEINSSFYKVPKVATVIKWAESVGDNFQFTFKLSKIITHSKALDFSVEDINQFLQVIDHIGNRKGCLLIQFPPALTIEKIHEVQKLLSHIKECDKNCSWKIAIEFRHPSWYNNETYALLYAHNASVVMHDLPASTTPIAETKASFRYVRFHGPGGRYRGSYDDDFLYAHAQNIKTWMSNGQTVYVYFNNTMGDAIKNLQTLNNYVLS